MIIKIYSILSQKERRQLPLLFFEILLGAILETVGISAIIPIVKILIDPSILEESETLTKLYLWSKCGNINSFVVMLLFALVIYYLMKNSFLFLMYYHQYRFINKGQMILTDRLFTSYFSQEYSYFTRRNIADIQRNVAADVGRCYQTILSFISVFTQSSMAAALICYLLIKDFITTVIVLGMIAVFMLVFMKLTHNMLLVFGQESRTNGSRVIQWVNQSIIGIKEVKLFNREQYFKKKINDYYKKSSVAETKTNVISTLPNLFMETICIVSIIMACIVRIKQGGDLSGFISTLLAFALAAIRLIPNVGGISSKLNMITFNKASIDGIYKELNDLNTINGGAQYIEIDASDTKMPFTDCIHVDNVSFRYSDSESNVLTNITMDIHKGESVAFVGTSGAGKTTLADLILGILKPTSGGIIVDGVSIEEDIHGWYNQIGYIPQSIYLIDDSIRNNVAFGVDPSEIDDDRVWLALKKAQLDSFVKGLPQGLDSNLGDRGVRCSGGQRQRIGIARALYNDPEFLILDEATSALDNDTEKAIMDAIDDLKGEKTLLIIAHRLSTIKNCDSVYRIENHVLIKEK